MSNDPQFISEIEDGVRVLESRGQTGPIPASEAKAAVQQLAETAKPIAKHGEVGNGRAESRVYNVNSTPVGGNRSGYLTARIARDRPDILERMKAGEFKSVRAAAIEAGIVSL